jgi:hypothetical protein
VEDYKISPPPRAAMKENMEALIHHFLLFTKPKWAKPGARILQRYGRSLPSLTRKTPISPLGASILLADAVAIIGKSLFPVFFNPSF